MAHRRSAGTHVVQMWVRSAGISAPYEAWLGTDSFSVVVDPLSSLSLRAEIVFPIPTNTPIHWMATVSGGVAPLQYRFVMANPAGVWSIARDHAPSNTFTAPYEGYAGTPYFVVK